MKTLIFIPARGGSKGIPQKNIANYLGKPLIKQTLDVAIEFKKNYSNTDIIVSTDSVEISNYVNEFPGITVSKRPKELSTDESKTIDALLYILQSSNETIPYDRVVTLQPTSPLRKLYHLIEATSLFDFSGAISLISCYSIEGFTNKLYLIENSIVKPIEINHNLGTPRQLEKKVYIRNGAIYITRVEYLIKENKIISDQPIIYEMSKNSSIDINEPLDLIMAEILENHE